MPDLPKLVRDKIPEIIQNNGENPVIRIATPDELLQLLSSKLQEESAEVAQSGADIQELADVAEVLLAILAQKWLTWQDLEQVRKQKVAQRWWFDKGIVLLDIKP